MADLSAWLKWRAGVEGVDCPGGGDCPGGDDCLGGDDDPPGTDEDCLGDVLGWAHPSAISFFRIHTILHDILGFDTIITRYYTIFSFGKICA